MEIQQHDGVVVEVAGIPAGLRQAQAGGRGVAGGEGGARGCCVAALPPPLYIGPLGKGGHRPNSSRVGAAAKGGALPPMPGGAAALGVAPPPLRLREMGWEGRSAPYWADVPPPLGP